MTALGILAAAACGGSTGGDDLGTGGADSGVTGGAAGSGTGGTAGSSTGGSGGSATGGVGGAATGGTGGSAAGGAGGSSAAGGSAGATGGAGGSSAAGGAGGSATGGTGGSAAAGGAGGSAAAGGAGGTGGSGGNPTLCSSVCQKIDQAGCPNDEPYGACFAGCQIDLQNYQAQCSSEVNAWLTCAMGPGVVSCTSDGDSRVTGCNSQLVAFVKCGGCIPSSGDDACDACTKSSCCSQLQAVYAHAEFTSYLNCVYGCATQQCEYACYVQHSGLQAPINALLACQGQSCASC